MKFAFLFAAAAVLAAPCFADQYIFGFSGPSDVSLITNAGTYTTGTNEFNAGVPNQGWWSATLPNFAANPNYFAGAIGSGSANNFFTFFIPADRDTITSAMLSIPQATVVGDAFTYYLYDVSTDAATLNDKDGTSSAIFDDLGSGVSYGSAFVGANSGASDPLLIALNANGIAAIDATRDGFFSIGGDPPTSTPEPASLVLLASALLAVPAGKRLFKLRNSR